MWPNSNSLVGLKLWTLRGDMMLGLAPWFYPTAVHCESLIQSYTDTSEILPEHLPSVVALSWDWRSRVPIPVHYVLRRHSVSLEEAYAALLGIAFLRQHRVPFEVPLPDGFTFDVLFNRNRGKISYCDRSARVATFAWRSALAARQEPMCWARLILRANFSYRHSRT